MRKLFKKLNILLIMLILILSPSTNVFAKTFDSKPGDTHKTWTVTFNKDVDISTIQDNILVENELGEIVNTTVETNGTVAKIKPPKEGYAPGEYTIKVKDEIKSTTGKGMKEPYEMKFTVTPKKIGELKVHYIDVGQADSILIQQNGKNMLIDAGNNADGDLVVDYLKKQGVSKLDYVIATHPHEDHIGGLDNVINTFNIGKIYMPQVNSTTQTYKDVITAITNKGLKITIPVAGDNISLGDAVATILAPNGTDYIDTNNYSIALKLKFGNNSFIFMGDAEDISEGEILEKQLDISADVLKVGHHGSSSSTTEEFLNAVNPKYAVISVGEGNSYGHPHKSVMDRLKSKGTKVYRTDESGTIVATSDGENITFNTKPGSYEGNEDKGSNDKDEVKPPVETNKDIQITNVDLIGEIVTIKNNENIDVDMTGWRLVSVEGPQTYNFPAGYILKAGATVTIASGRATGDLKWTGRYIWNNDGDKAELYDPNNNLISSK